MVSASRGVVVGIDWYPSALRHVTTTLQRHSIWVRVPVSVYIFLSACVVFSQTLN
jgi:hypothetical protein